MCVKRIVWNPNIVWNACETDKYLKSINGGSVVICNKVIHLIKTIPTVQKKYFNKNYSIKFQRKTGYL